MNRKKRVLFLCTGNSCRSQMAEGLLRHFGGDEYEAFSAGTHPSAVNPRAIEAMNEIGIDISNHYSKSLDIFLNEEFDAVVTVCDRAKGSCPYFHGAKQRLHWGLDDPAEAEGTEEEIMKVFRGVRDQISEKIKALTTVQS